MEMRGATVLSCLNCPFIYTSWYTSSQDVSGLVLTSVVNLAEVQNAHWSCWARAWSQILAKIYFIPILIFLHRRTNLPETPLLSSLNKRLIFHQPLTLFALLVWIIPTILQTHTLNSHCRNHQRQKFLFVTVLFVQIIMLMSVIYCATYCWLNPTNCVFV